MVEIFSAASGRFVAQLSAPDVKTLKTLLGQQLSKSRFQLRLLEGSKELQDEVDLAAFKALQLVILSLLPPHEQRDSSFLAACADGLVDVVEQSLRCLQDPTVGHPLHAAASRLDASSLEAFSHPNGGELEDFGHFTSDFRMSRAQERSSRGGPALTRWLRHCGGRYGGRHAPALRR